MYFGITESISIITHHFDNQEAIRRLNELDDFEHKANPTTTDYDVWSAMKEATEIQPGTHIGKHVKGHQRATKKKPVLSPEAIMNNRMDELAGTCRTENTTPLQAATHKGNKISLSINHHTITANIHTSLRAERTSAPICRYIMDKEEWTDTTMKFIDWDTHSAYPKTIPFNKKVNVVKMCHD